MIKNKQHILHLSREILNHLEVLTNLHNDNLIIKNAVTSAKCIIQVIIDEAEK
jgi:hypothetical protein